jgi:hemerythrin
VEQGMSIQWDESMSVGVPVLDEDHKTLIRLINDYTDALENDEGLFVTDSIFSALGDYIHYHFTREEGIMEMAGYPDLERHKKSHRSLEEHFLELRESYVLYPNAAAEEKVKIFLEDWLCSHILKIDMAYKPLVEPLVAAGKI